MSSIEGKVALVTGAGQGIGRGIALRLARDGADVALVDVKADKIEAVAGEIRALGRKAATFVADISKRDQVRAAVDHAEQALGGFDIMVNNAGINRDGQLFKMSDEDWNLVIGVNLTGTFYCTRAAAQIMREKGYGRIVNISSGTPFKGTPNLLHYVTSKGAILALTRALAREVGGDGICVNTLAPGLVLSEGVIQNIDMREKLTGPVLASRAIKRDQTPEDLIEPLLFLASDACAFMTGETLVVDGGSVMH